MPNELSTATDRRALIQRYAAGPQLLRNSIARLSKDAIAWRPAPGKWSVHEIVGHCADSETVAAVRLRYLIGEDQPTIVGYDQDRWAARFDYGGLPFDVLLGQVEQVRAWTTALIERLPESAWERDGVHTESGRYTAAKWLGLYAEHLEAHARQIDRNLAAWNARAR